MVTVGDSPTAWAQAGFSMEGSATRIGSTTIVCDPAAGEGITQVTIRGLDGPLDGLAITSDTPPAVPNQTHANGVSGFDHLVAMSPDIERTSGALRSAGLDRRRTRVFTVGKERRRQDFFWLGDVVLELVGVAPSETETAETVPDDSTRGRDVSPASFWGLALECADLDTAAAELGDRLGRIKDAVQPGRRIATLRTRELGIGVPIALMSPHPRD